MEYRVLGPLEVARPGGEPVKIEGAKTRALLVLLLLSRNTVVMPDRIADQLWAGDPPPSSAGTIHAYVSKLRRALSDTGAGHDLITRKPGYVLRVAPHVYDADRFETLVRQASGAPAEQASTILSQALSLWRGSAFAEFSDIAPAALEAERLAEVRLVALERHAEAELALRRPGTLIPELERLIAENPYREGLTCLLMTALYRSGRQSDALRAYQATYRLLVEEIGVVPGPTLRALESAILNQDPSLDPPLAPVAALASPRHVEPPPAVARLRDRPLFGRDEELAELKAIWSRLGPSDCRLVVVAGETGIGKSRLVAELAHELAEGGAAVLWGRAPDRELVPYQPMVEALGDFLAAREAREASAIANAAGPPLGWLLPDLSYDPPLVAASAEPAARRYLMFEAVAVALAEITGPAGLVLVLEDLHLADVSALSLMEHLVRRARRGPMAVVVTLDNALVDSHVALRDLLVSLGRDGRLDRMSLAGLSEAAVGALVADAAGAAPAASVPALHARTHGNPLFIKELTRAGGSPATLPTRIRDVVAMRLDRLDPDLTEVLQAATLLGADFEPELLAAVLQRPVDAILDRAFRAGLVDSLPGTAQRLHFVHQVVYDAVAAGLTPARTANLRRRLVDSLDGRTGRADYYAMLAHHYRLTSGEDARRSVVYARRAGDHALDRLGFTEAAQHFAEALDTLSAVAGDQRLERCELLLRLGTARRALYQRQATQQAFQEAAELAIELSASDLVVRAAWGLLSISEFSASSPATVAVFEHGLAALAPGETRQRTALTAGLGRALPHGPRAVALAREAIELARSLDDAEALLVALGGGLLAIWAPDNLDERIAFSSELIATGHAWGWVELAHEARAWRAACAEELGDQAAADADLDAIRVWANASRQPFFLGLLDLRDAARALSQGRFEEAERFATAAVQGIDAGPDFHAGYGAQLFTLRRDQGRLAEIDAMLTNLVDGSPRVPAWRAARAVADIELGRTESAASTVKSLAMDGFAGLPRDWLWLSAIGHLADCCADLALLGVRVPAAAEQLYRLLTPYRDRCMVLAHGVLCNGSVARQLGGLAAALGRYDEAAIHFEAAIVSNRRQQALPWLARTQLGYADALLRRGAMDDADRAADLRAEAAAIIATIGADGIAWRSRLLGERLATHRARLMPTPDVAAMVDLKDS